MASDYVLRIGRHVEESFEHSEGFQIMALLMDRSETFQLTYPIYMRFYGILQSLSEPDLQDSVVHSILTNFALISKSSLEAQRRIVKQWVRPAAEPLSAMTEIMKAEKPTGDMTCLTIVHTLLKRANNEVFVAMLEFILLLHENCCLPDLPRQLHIQVLISEFVPGLVNDTVLAYLTGKVNDCGIVDLIPLCCFVALNIGYDAVYELFQILRPCQLCTVQRYWVVAAAVNSMTDVRMSILKFVLRCPKVEWRKFFCVLDLFGDAGTVYEFLVLLGRMLLSRESPDYNDYVEYFQLAECAVFFHEGCRS
jgi:hypothetical protein